MVFFQMIYQLPITTTTMVTRDSNDTNGRGWGIHFTRNVTPIPKPRPKHAYQGRRIHVWNPKQAQEDEFRRWMASELCDQGVFFREGENLQLNVTFRFPRPDSHFVNRNRNNNIKTTCRLETPHKGDSDNFVKFVMDALNKCLYEDDKQVVGHMGVLLWNENALDLQGSTTVAAFKVVVSPVF
jgi:Holliday junction resolvase RusA-like endonuclease